MITSKQNSLIKQIRSLDSKKFRDELGLYVLEGYKLVQEAVNLSLDIQVVVATEKGVNFVDVKQNRTEIVSDEVFLSISAEKSPQGVLCVVKKPDNDLKAPSGNCLLLDGVSDPSNVGAIVRTAAATGFDTVYMTEDCADAFSPKATRCSMSGVFRVKIIRDNLDKLLSVINLPIYVADMNGENVFEHKRGGNVCLVIGNEGHGVSDDLKKKAVVTVSIPMKNGVESLNASVSAGILMCALKD